jgi:ATP/maltotriose-dependent transcriptional regulator MalT
MVTAPPGSGKTVLLRSWLGEAGLAESAAWVSVGRDERDPQRLWLSVLDALCQTVPGSALVRPLTAAPDLDGWAIVERLLKDLAPLDQRLWLVIDDLHELGSDQARQHLELLVMRAPAELRFVLATRHDVRLGLHRLRLEGELTEIRAADLRFSLAERNGWTDDLFAGFAAMTLGAALAWQGRLDEAETWVQHAEQTFKAEANPAAAMGGHYVRGQLELGRGRAAEALAAFRAAERLAGPHPLARPLRIWLVHALVRLGEIDQAEQALASIGERDRDRGEMRVAAAVLRLTQDDPHGATVALAPVLDGSARVGWRSWLVEVFLLEAIARDALGDQAAAGGALERALDLAEPEGALLWFLLHPAPGLLERQARQRTAHPALIARILALLTLFGGPGGHGGAGSPSVIRGGLAGIVPPRLAKLTPLSKSELRVLRYLPTHLSGPEIAAELSVSTTTVKTHLRNLYAKLSAHSRTEAVESARTLGLLAPSAHQR